MKRILSLISVLFPVLFTAYPGETQAGWILTGRYIDQDGKTILQRYFIENSKMKFEQYNLIYTIDFLSGELILVDPEKLIYFKGTLNSYISEVKRLKYDQLDQLISRLPESQQVDTHAEYSRPLKNFGERPRPVSDTVNLSRLPDSLIIVGQPSEKYLVSVGKQKVEELWISPGLKINDVFSWPDYLYYLSVLEPENRTINYMVSDAYLQMLNNGFPSRRIMIISGYRTEFQLNKIENKIIPEYEFLTPVLCKEISLESWLNRNAKEIPVYDDYE
jgi:hypothetical protein